MTKMAPAAAPLSVRWTVLVFLLACSEQISGQSFMPAGFQQASLQNVYASSAVYRNGTVIITGTTWQGEHNEKGSCFVASARLSSTGGTIQLLHDQTLANDQQDVSEGCTAMVYDDKNLFVAGHAAEGGLLHGLQRAGSLQQTTRYGTILDLEPSSTIEGGWNVVGGRVLQSAAVVVPVGLASDYDDAGRGLYVVSLETENVARDAQVVSEGVNATEVLGSDGNDFVMAIQKLERYDNMQYAEGALQQTFKETWRTPYGTTENDADLMVAGVRQLSHDVLVVAGSTNGHGVALGTVDEYGSGTDYDGFVVLLDPASGSIVSDDDGNPGVLRLQSPTDQDDFIHAICHGPLDPLHFYVVGQTMGRLDDAQKEDGPVEMYIAKISVETLSITWTKQFATDAASNADGAVRGLACAVTFDNEVVYVAGVVEDGGVMRQAGVLEGHGGRDVVLAHLSASDGRLINLRQVGTREDDELAARGGLLVDENGNAILVGNTRGSLYRRRGPGETNVSNVFILTVSRFNGDYRQPVEQPTVEDDNDDDDGDRPIAENPDNVGAPAPDETAKSHLALAKWSTMLMVLTVTVVAISCYVKAQRKHREVSTDRTLILHYLQDFEVEDIDLKHSATGGWHCWYANDLAKGINHATRYSPDGGNGLLMAPSSSSLSASDRSEYHDPLIAPRNSSRRSGGGSLLEDSLFMDEFRPRPNLGSPEQEEVSRDTDYDGLVRGSAGGDDHSQRRSSRHKKSKRSKGSSSKPERWGRDII